MPLILLLLGVVTTIAGAVLVASGLTFHGGTFDIEAITPGTVAAVGGLLLIGMGLAVRELKRIERALAARPTPRINRRAMTPLSWPRELSHRSAFRSRPNRKSCRQ